jgi:hypothetical protein
MRKYRSATGAALQCRALFGGGEGWGLCRGEHGGGFFGDAGAFEEAWILLPHSRTALAKVTLRKSSAVMWPYSTSS